MALFIPALSPAKHTNTHTQLQTQTLDCPQECFPACRRAYFLQQQRLVCQASGNAPWKLLAVSCEMNLSFPEFLTTMPTKKEKNANNAHKQRLPLHLQITLQPCSRVKVFASLKSPVVFKQQRIVWLLIQRKFDVNSELLKCMSGFIVQGSELDDPPADSPSKA